MGLSIKGLCLLKLKKYNVTLNFTYGKVIEFKSVNKPLLVNAGVLKVGEEYINMINVEHYSISKEI